MESITTYRTIPSENQLTGPFTTDGKRATLRKVGKAEMPSRQKNLSPAWQPTTKESHKLELLEEWGVRAPHQVPQSLESARERDKFPKHLAMKTNRAHIHKIQRAVVNWDTSLNGLAYRLTHPAINAKEAFWEVPGLYMKKTHLLIRHLPEGQGPGETL